MTTPSAQVNSSALAHDSHPNAKRDGTLLVLGSALIWSFGGALARFLSASEPWTIVFWRSLFGVGFLLAYALWRDGPRLTFTHFRRMGLPGLGVGLCFTSASISFVVALQYTTVANILLVQAGGPLIAASMAWALFRERVTLGTWIAIATVIFGIFVMVSESFDGSVSPIGGLLSLVIALAFAIATVITRRFSHVEMIPAVTFGVGVAAVFAFFQANTFAISATDALVLFAFGAVNLGGGLAMFVAGARLIPASAASLIGTAEPVLGPVWVWLVHGETPSLHTLTGGLIVLAALIGHSLSQLWARPNS